MRNWNSSISFSVNIHHHVFIVPMRNWNSGVRGFTFAPCGVFIVPMRNWNRWKAPWGEHHPPFLSYLWGIETDVAPDKTYVIKEFLSYLWGIETILPRLALWLLEGFYRTYEELKPQEQFGKLFGIVKSFLSYLWGIETKATEYINNA